MPELDLMTTHCEALFVHNEHQDLVCSNEWLSRPAPLLWLGFSRAGILWRFREDVAAAIRGQVEQFIKQEAWRPTGRFPRHHETYRTLLNAPNGTAGPTYWLPALKAPADPRVQRITPANAGLLQHSELAAWLTDIPHQQPMFAAVVDGQAVAVCASVRQTAVAHEAGVETLPQQRRRGHGAAVVAAWAQALLQAGVRPLYSTAWENLASQGVARRVGFTAFGWEYRLG